MKRYECPRCNNNNLKLYDKVKRIVKRPGGVKQWIDIMRFKCTNCNLIHRQLPDIVTPFKHYDAEIIQGVKDGYITSETLGYEDYPCEETMKRWKK